MEDPVLIMTRDDCGNTWHALHDFMITFTSGVIVGIPPEKRHVLVLDQRLMISDDADDLKQCPYHGTYDALGRLGVLRGVQFNGKRVLFKKLIVSAETPEKLLGQVGVYLMSMQCAPVQHG